VVAKLVEAATKPQNHRYSVSRGIYKLRLAITGWYKRRYGVELDADTEAIVTIGAKEGISPLAWATIDPGDVVLCPSPTYPIHQFAVVLAGGDLRCIPLTTSEAFFGNLEEAIRQTWPNPRC
jgi:alanine-synthesizing transaminase